MVRAHGARGFTAVLSGFIVAAALFGLPPVTAGASTTSPVEVALIVPIVADAGDGLFLTAGEMEAATAPSGEWALLTTTARVHNLTVALDTRIVESIDELGAAVPASVSSWLDSVLELDPLLLPYGNPDLWALSAAGDRDFGAATIAALSGVSPNELIVWPSEALYRADSLAVLKDSGYSKILISDAVSTGGFSRALSDNCELLLAEDSPLTPVQAAAALRDELFAGAVLTLPRNPEAFAASRAVTIIDELAQSEVRFTEAMPALIPSSRQLSDVGSIPDLFRDALGALDSDEALVATMTNDRDELLSNRIRALSVLSSDLQSPRFDDAAQSFLVDTRWLSSVISISLASEYTVLSNAANVPLSVSNNSDATVTVTVKVRATSAIVQVDSPFQSITIEPRSNVRIEIPISTVANGRTMIIASLLSPSGVAVGDDVTLPVTVQAEWEAFTLVIFGGVVATIMVIGAIRTIGRRRAVP
jgi:hypothetical protein